MSDAPTRLNLGMRIDDACERYESAWRSDRPLTIEQVLAEAEVDEAERPHLYRELLLLDIELRSRATAQGFRERFPEYLYVTQEVIDRVFGGVTLADALKGGSGSGGSQVGVVTQERYEILEPIARGGLGLVFRARDQALDRELALKEIRPDRDDGPARARFAREARLTCRLEHPGVVPVHGLGCHSDGRPFYVMRLIRGETLKEAITRFHAESPSLDPGARAIALNALLERFLGVCDAVEYAHSRGVVHRDLKPANVMIGSFGETLVVDWGLAKSLAPEPGDVEAACGAPNGQGEDVYATARGKAVGTPQYMSPEQASGQHDQTGTASDVYSLGATLYELIVGDAPFGESYGSELVMRRVIAGDFRRPREARPGVPRALEAVCLKAMALKPADRYTSARALADDLRRWLAGEPVSAFREPVWDLARRFLARHKLPAATAAGGLAVAAVAATAFAFSARLEDTRERTRAQERVSAILSARGEALTGLVTGPGLDRARVSRLLREKFRDPALDEPSRLRVALALGANWPEAAAFVEGKILDSDPTILPLACGVLERLDRRPTVQRLWLTLEDEREVGARRFAAAFALARLDPPAGDAVHRRWAAQGEAVAGQLVEAVAADPGRFNVLVETFRPVRRDLFGPLASRFRDVPFDRFDAGLAARRTIAAALLDRFATTPEEVAALIPDTLTGTRLVAYVDRLRSFGEEGVAALVAELTREDTTPLPPQAGVPADRERLASFRARRKGRLAAVLVELGRHDPVWPWLGSSADPSVRSELLSTLPGVPGGFRHAVAGRLAVETDAVARGSLALILGAMGPEGFEAVDRQSLTARLLDWYRDDADPGVHAAADWALRQRWGAGEELARLDAAFAGQPAPPGRRWFVSREGQTFSVVPGPVMARLGSPEDEPGRGDAEGSRTRRIDRTFAVSSREVTLAEYRRFLRDVPAHAPPLGDPEFVAMARSDDAPVVGVSWLDAARYCNWLSRREGLPEAEWCYPEPLDEGAPLPPDLLSRRGYRLPTEAEWEFACRSGSTTSRPFGDAWHVAPDHGWFVGNAQARLHPVGHRFPNSLGFFDMLGNASEWTLDHERPGEEGPAPDAWQGGAFTLDESRVVRGGSVLLPDRPRSAYRDGSLPGNRLPDLGFRLARTIRE
jgi:formylglycine-generating enzyme required for sulfatase activity